VNFIGPCEFINLTKKSHTTVISMLGRISTLMRSVFFVLVVKLNRTDNSFAAGE